MDQSPRLYGKEWENWANQLLCLRYGPGGYQRVPDEQKGDAGLEGFSINKGHASSSLKSPPLISVDGGVVIDNTLMLVKAGANHLVIGTAIFSNHNAVENIRRMREAIKE